MKTGLVLSGGGSKGAFQVGALDYLMRRENVVFDFVSGVSTGSLQGAMVAQNQLTNLAKIWFNLKKNTDIYNTGYIRLLWGGYPYSFNGMETLLKKYLKKTYDIPFMVGIVSLETGKYYSFKNPNIEMVLASCSIPILFPPRYIDILRENCVDGGIRNITPLKEAIDFGCDTIYVITCYNEEEEFPIMKQKWGFLDSLKRTIDILVDEVKQNDIITQDIRQANHINGVINDPSIIGFTSPNGTPYREIKIIRIQPWIKDMVGVDSLYFGQDQIQTLYQKGMDAAEEIGFR